MQTQKRFNLNEILDSMTNTPHTVEVAQYKRGGDGSIAFTFKAHFKIECAFEDFAATTNEVLTELQSKDIRTKRVDFTWLRFDEFRQFDSGKAQTIETTLIVELITPDQIAEKEARDEDFFEGIREHFNESKTVDGAVVN